MSVRIRIASGAIQTGHRHLCFERQDRSQDIQIAIGSHYIDHCMAETVLGRVKCKGCGVEGERVDSCNMGRGRRRRKEGECLGGVVRQWDIVFAMSRASARASRGESHGFAHIRVTKSGQDAP